MVQVPSFFLFPFFFFFEIFFCGFLSEDHGLFLLERLPLVPPGADSVFSYGFLYPPSLAVRGS